VAAKALVKHAEEQAAELENTCIDMQNAAVYEFLSGSSALKYVFDKNKEVLSKCRTYGRALLNGLLDINWKNATKFKEEEAVWKSYLRSDDDGADSTWITTVLDWGRINT
jgi:hypothetical protein